MVVPFVSWHAGSLPADTVTGVGMPTLGVTFTVLVLIVDVPQPVAVTWIFTLPENPLAQLITPVAGSIDPAALLLSDQLKPVLLVAVVE